MFNIQWFNKKGGQRHLHRFKNQEVVYHEFSGDSREGAECLFYSSITD